MGELRLLLRHPGRVDLPERPAQEDLPATPTPEPDLLQPDELEGSIASSSLLQRYLLPICLVGGVVLVTLAVMLAVFLPRRKR